jgi:hypothetical protein
MQLHTTYLPKAGRAESEQCQPDIAWRASTELDVEVLAAQVPSFACPTGQTNLALSSTLDLVASCSEPAGLAEPGLDNIYIYWSRLTYSNVWGFY